MGIGDTANKKHNLRPALIISAALICCFIVIFAVNSKSVDLLFDAQDGELNSISDISLGTGVYDVSVAYDLPADSGYGIATVEAADPSLTHALDSNVILLPYYRHSVDFPIYLTKEAKDITLNIASPSEDVPLLVSYVMIHRRRLASSFYVFWNFLLIMTAAVGVPFFLYRIYKNDDKVVRLKNVGLMLIFGILCIPALIDYLPGAVDLYIHLNRLEGIADGLILDHTFPVRIHSSMWNDHGYPFGVFYGDLFYYISAVLYALGLPLWRAYRAYVILINAVTVLLSYRCFTEIGRIYSDDEDRCCRTGLFGTAIFSLNIWHLTAIYGRAAVGAYTSYTFIPLVVAGVVMLAVREDGAFNGVSGIFERRSFFYITLGFIGIAISHILTLFVMVLGLGILTIVYLVMNRKNMAGNIGRLLTLCASAVTSVLGSLGFLLPVFHMTKTHDLYISNFTEHMQKYGVYLAQLFMVRYNTGGLAAPLSGVSEDWPQTMGLALIGCGLTAICLVMIRKNIKQTKPIIVLFILTCLSIFMASPVFPYDTIQAKIPRLFSLLGRVQTSNRYLLIGTVALTVIGILILQELYESDAGKHSGIYMASILAVLLLQGIMYYSDFLYEAPVVSALSADDAAVMSYSDDLLYTFNACDKEAPYHESGLEATEGLNLGEQYRRGTTYIAYVSDDTGSGGYLKYPVYAYMGYKIQDDNGNKLPVLETEDHMIETQIPGGYTGNITLKYSEPILWRIAEIISLIMNLLLFCGIFKKTHSMAIDERGRL